MAVYIYHASISENNTVNGTAGDQTGKEVCVRTWYSKPWNVLLRYGESAQKSARAAEIGKKLCNCGLVGYSQKERNTLYQALKKYNWDVDAYIASGEKTNTDCSAFQYAIWCCILPAMRNDGNAPTTKTMKDIFCRYGFTAYTNAEYLQSTYTRPGDMHLKEGYHVIGILSNDKYSADVDISALIAKGLNALKRLAGKSESNIKKAKVMALQAAINKDYHMNIEVDGIIGPETTKALGNHYIARNEKQYMVTAAEIIMYLSGKDAKGIEFPGSYENGLASALGTNKLTAQDFINLCQ